MPDLLPILFKRGITGSASELDLRLLAWLANPDVNRKVFGQPLPQVLGYYESDLRALLTMAEQNDKPRE